ncbi:MAG: phosphoglucosamine mutase [Promethearchaeati archaeon SRVP18_Atabeyarchaeia-1]
MDVEDIFREYDIRGVFNQDLTPEVISKIGVAFGTFLQGSGEVVVGRDTRVSSQILESIFSSSLASMGCDVTTVGMVPISVVNFSTWNRKPKAGAVVTASHNPPEYNGLRFRHSDGTGYVSENKAIRDLYFGGRFLKKRWNEVGRIASIASSETLTNYSGFIRDRVRIGRKLRVALDPGNGAACIVAPTLFKELGFEVFAINDRPDGTFPGRDPDPSVEGREVLSELSELVAKSKADFGVAYDGDGDRAVFVDEVGERAIPEKVAILFANEYLNKGKKKIVANVSCSMILEDELSKAGGEVIRVRVGDVFITEAIKVYKAAFAVEISSHFYFPDFYPFDDGILASIKLAEILSHSHEAFSEYLRKIRTYPSLRENVECPDRIKFKVIEIIKEKYQNEGYKIDLVDGIRVVMSEGWGLVRQSNTEPKIRITVEGRTKEASERLLSKFKFDVANAIKKIGGLPPA